MSSKKVFGLDLGTGNSCVSCIEAGKPVVTVNAEGNRTTPSVVFIKGDDRKVGASAKRGMIMNPKNTISFIKRFMGADYNDPDVQKMLKSITYDVVNKNGKPYVKIDSKEYSPVEISSMIVAEMGKVAEDYYGVAPSSIVVTVPAWFNDRQRNDTKLACEAAGYEVLRVINEPTAAILSSNIDTKGKEKLILVTDVGCGTTDFSLCEVSEGMIEVLASYGDVFLGGADIDNAIVDWMVAEFKKDKGIDLSLDQMAYARLVEAAEKAKCELSTANQTNINLPYITFADNIPQNLDMTLSRAKFESLINGWVNRVIDCANKAVEKAGRSASDIDEILLVGGSTRVTSLQDALTKEFGKPLNKSVNPDEAVSLGAATQANILAGNVSDSDILLLDVTPVSLGIETEGSVMTKLIEANTTIPTSKTQIFTTAVDNQPAVTIKVLQGERPLSMDNKQIGIFNLDGIAPARRGVPQIEVKFDIDANGIVSVSAKDLGTGKEQHITIEGGNSLSEEEIAQIKADAEKHKEEDERKRDEIQKVNAAESYSLSIANMLDDENFKDKITEDERKEVTDLKTELDKAISERNLSNIESVKDALEKVWNPIVQKLYAQANPNGANVDPNIFKNMGDNNPFADGMTDMFGKGAKA